MSGPPDKWNGFSTSGMNLTQFINELNSAHDQGYTGQAIVVPVPGATDGSSWIAVAGYGSTTED